MQKNILIIKASDDVCKVEIAHICTTAVFFNIKPQVIEIDTLASLDNRVKSLNTRFDYIYLCAHANQYGFGDNKNLFVPWMDFGSTICEEAVINEGCVFLLACCRSGLNKVAYDLFASCELIEFVCGPRWSLEDKDLTVAFTVFLYNIEVKKMQPDHAAQRMSNAVGYDFKCFDRVETELTSDYQNYYSKLVAQYEQGESERQTDSSFTAEEILAIDNI